MDTPSPTPVSPITALELCKRVEDGVETYWYRTMEIWIPIHEDAHVWDVFYEADNDGSSLPPAV